MTSKRPQDLVFTLFGEYLLTRDRPVWVGSLITLLRPFNLSEGAVRTVLSRMTKKKWLKSRRRGRNSYYDLTVRGQKLLAEGKHRIFHPSWGDAWDEQWYLLSYSIPEDRRHLRDRLRVRLAWLGFGSMGNGIWISPHDVGRRVEEMAEEMGIREHLICFRAQSLGASDHADLVDRCWDLPALAARYCAFLELWRPGLDYIRQGLAGGTLSDEGCFVHRFNLLHEFRAFPLEDPYLPAALLPDAWPGREAAQLFNELHNLLEEPAERYLEAVLSDEPALASTGGGG
ncbi:MAG: PaaX family transcriptional regulator C-terminal domain-containing protein [Gemmatimonadota bacterium]|jgi:phenylacetic acid degradation operon negative regulatory protein